MRYWVAGTLLCHGLLYCPRTTRRGRPRQVTQLPAQTPRLAKATLSRAEYRHRCYRCRLPRVRSLSNVIQCVCAYHADTLAIVTMYFRLSSSFVEIYDYHSLGYEAHVPVCPDCFPMCCLVQKIGSCEQCVLNCCSDVGPPLSLSLSFSLSPSLWVVVFGYATVERIWLVLLKPAWSMTYIGHSCFSFLI